MPKSANNKVLDGSLNIVGSANLMIVCNAFPYSRYDAINTFALADVVMDPNTDFVTAEGTIDGRKIIIAAKSTVAVDTTGEATHIALLNDTDLLYVTTCLAQQLNALNTVDIPSWSIEISDPI